MTLTLRLVRTIARVFELLIADTYQIRAPFISFRLGIIFS